MYKNNQLWMEGVMHRKILISLGVLFLLTSVSLAATTYNVPGASATIQGAIDLCADGDEVVVGDQTFDSHLIRLSRGAMVAGEDNNKNLSLGKIAQFMILTVHPRKIKIRRTLPNLQYLGHPRSRQAHTCRKKRQSHSN